MPFSRRFIYIAPLLLHLFLLPKPVLSQPPLLPVRQLFVSNYPAQSVKSIWRQNNEFRVVIGYSNACTIAGPDSLNWRTGQLNGIRVGFDRVPLDAGSEVVAIAVKNYQTTALRIYHPENGLQNEIIAVVADSNYWINGVNYQIYDSITAVESIQGDDGSGGLLVYATSKESKTFSQGADRTWQLTGSLRWRDLNRNQTLGNFSTGGISAVKCLEIPGEQAPLIYYGVTYETGSFSYDTGGAASMVCELVRFDLESGSEMVFQSLISDRNGEGTAPARVIVGQIEVGVHPEVGLVVFAVYGVGGAEYLTLFEGGGLEPISTVHLPPESERGGLANIAYFGMGVEGGADLLCVYKHGSVIAVWIAEDSLLTSEYTLDGRLYSAAAGNFDEDEDLELVVTLARRLKVFDLLPLDVANNEIPLPANFGIEAFPNPFNSRLTIRYQSVKSVQSVVNIFDLSGRLVADFSKTTPPYSPPSIEGGVCALIWDATSVPAGVYFVRLQSGSAVATKKVVLMR